jgi:hypothetical protein
MPVNRITMCGTTWCQDCKRAKNSSASTACLTILSTLTRTRMAWESSSRPTLEHGSSRRSSSQTGRCWWSPPTPILRSGSESRRGPTALLRRCDHRRWTCWTNRGGVRGPRRPRYAGSGGRWVRWRSGCDRAVGQLSGLSRGHRGVGSLPTASRHTPVAERRAPHPHARSAASLAA